MRRRGSWRFKAALLLALSPLTAAASEPDPADSKAPDKPAASPSLFGRWFSPAAGKPETRTAAKEADRGPAAGTIPPQRPPEGTAERAREKDKLLRRLEACDRIQEVADATNDPALWSQAQELAERSYQVYEQRIARIPIHYHITGPVTTPDGQ